MSDQRTGELAVAQPPPTHQNAASNAVQEQSNPSFTNDASPADPVVAPLAQSSQHSAQTNQASASDSHTDQGDTTSSIPASGSERDVEAMTAVQERSEQHQDPNGASRDAETGNTSSSSAQVSAGAARKFTSLNVNKRFLEKAAPTPPAASPAGLKLGASVSPRPANRLSSPSASTRLMSAKLSSVPKPQSVGWATTKPATPVAKTTTSSQTPTAITPAPTPAPATAPATATNTDSASDTSPTTTVTSSDPLPAEASAPTPKAISSPKPANASAAPQVASSTAGAAASPRLVSMGRDSPRPGSAGLESGSGQGRASPGLRNAALGSSLRAVSPANNFSRAPWAGVKSSLSPNPTPANSRGNRLSDFPTAAEAARAKQEQEEKAAAAAAREAARQQAAIQALDRFRGTSLGSGKHWDEMEDEDCGFFGEVVEFGDGSQYKIPTSNDRARNNGDDGPPVSKEDRFKDVSHDRSWPQRNAARRGNATQNERPRPAAAQSAAWGPLKNREAAVSAPTESAQPTSRPSRSEQRAEKVIIPTTGASVSLRSPTESREPMGFSYGRDRRSGPGPAPYSGGRQDHSGPPQPAQAATTQAVRAWGPLAQRQASLNPGAAPPASSAPAKPAQPVETAARSASTATSAAPEPARPSLPPAQPQEQPQQPRQQSRERPSVPATGLPNTNGRPLPPHLLVAGPGDGRPPAQTSRPLPPHLAQNLRPAVPAALANTVGRKTSHAIDEARHPNVPTSHVPHNEHSGSHLQHVQAAPAARQDRVGRAPWGPKAMAQARAPAPADVPTTQCSAPSAQPISIETEEDVHAAIERARKRREEEERQRLAEKERARQKALAIEERIRAAQQQKEAEAQRAAQAAQRQASQAAEAANATQASVETPAARKPGPADSATSWRTSRPQPVQAKSEEAKLHRQQASAQPLDQAAAAVNAVPAEQTRNGRVVSSQRDQRIGDERLPSRRNQREQRTSQLGDEGRQRGSKNQDKVGRPRIPYLEVPARIEDVTARIGQVEAPKTILARPARSPSTTSPVEARPRVSPAVAPIDSRPQKSASLSAQRAATKAGTSPRPRESAPQDRPSRMSVPAASPVATSAPVLAPVPVRLYPVVAKEANETRQEVVQDAPPAWNRYVVQIKGSRSRLKLNRYQQKQLFARMTAMKAPGRAVYPLTWDPPLAHLSMKTLSRDDQLFPKRFHRGAVITPVKLPSRVLPRGLAPVVPNLASQGVSAGSRKQARFDLTPHWSDGHNTIGGLGNGTASDAQPAGMSPSGQIQVRLPGHHATVVQPSAGGHFPDNVQAALMTANRRSQPVDPTTDAIIGEVLSAGASQTTFEDRSRAFPAGAAPGSLGPLDHPQNGYPTDTFGSHNSAGGYRSKGRRGSNAAVAFYDDRQVSTPSPVSFMVNSEIKADAGGARGSLSPFGMPGSTRASQAQTPASGGSMLPSPSLSTQGTWGQSSLTFPVLETRSSNLPDRDHIKNVWSLAANSHSGELQNSLKGIQDDFLPSTMPMSVHDFRADEGRLSGAQQDDGSGWGSSSFNRFQQYSRAQHDMNSSSRELSPVTNRSNGFDPTSRSPLLGMDASAATAAAARAREAGHHHQSVSQQASNAYSSINGGAYGSTTASSYSPRERQQDAGSGLSQGAFGAYGGYTSSASNNMSMTTDALYGVSNYGGGSMTPNRQTYSQYGAHSSAAAARSAPGSPYSGLSGRHSSTLTSGASGYSLFPTSGGSGGASGGSGGARTSQAGNGMEGLGVLDDTTFGSAAGRTQFYGARGYQQPSSTQQGQTQGSQQQHSTQKWPSSPASSGSVLRPAASVFNPQKYTQQRTSASQSQSQSQSQAQSQQARLAAHHHQQHHAHHGQLESSNGSGGPIDREANASAAGNNGGGYGSGASGYAGFGSSSGLW
ncbi:uncharacterized protein UHOD_02459 [Ustilago sp. UG-2017b]|nr:uncharacterized protein UHOD_02459 [Ustilago sp. UG-2017b]